jgi:hypothetical protein
MGAGAPDGVGVEKSSAVGKLSDGFAGKIVYLDDPGYAAARAVSNSMIDRRRR